MENISLILTVAIPIYTLIVCLLCSYLGHWLTMKAFAHVQPSTKDMTKIMKSHGVTTEEDWIKKAYEEDPSKDPTLEKMFSETGLPRSVLGDMSLEEFFKGRVDPNNFYGYDVDNVSDITGPEKENADAD